MMADNEKKDSTAEEAVNAEGIAAEKQEEPEKAKEAEKVQATTEKKPKKPRNKKKTWTTVGVIVVILVIAGFGFNAWHEQPSFCSAICHNMDAYGDTYNEAQGVPGVDKYGNAVSNTNAMLSVVHRSNATTANPTITCLECHVPTIQEQASEGMAFVSGKYVTPLDERMGSQLTSWKNADNTTFCANANCHSYLLDSDGTVNRAKLEETTMGMTFNPHSTHHETEFQCTTCHKSHRASVLTCTSCHEHENVAVPDGWLTAQESDQLMLKSFNG